MLRKIVGAVVGYIFIFVWVAVTLGIGWVTLGADFAFHQDTTEVTLGWVMLMIVTGFVGAVLAGWIASLVAKSQGGATALAVLILVLGLAMAVFYLNLDVAAEAEKALAGRDPASLGVTAAASVAIPPTWYNFLNPVLGALGVFVGGSLWSRRRQPADPAPA